MKKFEFKIVDNNQRLDKDGNYKKLDEFLNEYGQDGWELVDFQNMGSIQSCILQREIENHD